MKRYWTTGVHRKLYGKFYFNTDKWVLGIGFYRTPGLLIFSILIGPIETGFGWRTGCELSSSFTWR